MSPPTSIHATDGVNVRATEMAKVIARLDQLQAEALVEVNLGGFSPSSMGALYVYIRDLSGIRPGLDEGLQVTKRAIDELSGRRVTDTYGNLMVRAFSDDEAFEFWCSYAQTTGDTLVSVLKYASFRLDDIMISSVKNTWREIKDELAAPSAVLITILVLVVIIVILK